MAMGYYVLSKAKDNQFYFNLKAGNHETILTSERYTTKEAAHKGIASVQSNSPDESNFEYKTSVRGEPYFVLKAKNHQVIGTSEQYSAQEAAKKGVQSVIANGPTADIRDKTL
ncbi:DUF1508 domain-containing protein [Affinibrenneria salicis]|uniref:DUF1508 domain-containing protein n=1 Tax=Affinibrenneria salicis TaxID=2590031 RepID=A0A5J5FYQ0_9GAMM|nr:YegP family protein [Affinibrenneria salicis]KAA8998890.1 DUF1508 domain-containing protein [Affinibrenneria salicis]